MSSRVPRPVHAEHGGISLAALGDDLSSLDRRTDAVNADVLDAWYDPSPKVVAAIAAHLPWLLRTGPPPQAGGLARTISEVRGIPGENLLVGGGSSGLAYMVLPHVVRPGDRALLLDPTYGEYAHLLEIVHGMRCQRMRLRPEDGFRLGAPEVSKEMEACDVLVLVNPNNPTGSALGRDEVLEILARLPRFGWLVVDETFADFAEGATSVERMVPEHENLVVLKSMSTFYALAGARAGYVVGPEALIAKLRPACPPWSVGMIAQVAGVEALRDEAYYRARAEETRVLRDGFSAELGAIPGVKPHPSAANFLLLELCAGATAAEIAERLVEHGVYLRNCDSMGAHMDGRFLRAAVKDAAANRRIVEALRSVMPSPVMEAATPRVEAASLFRRRPRVVAPDGSSAADPGPAGSPGSPSPPASATPAPAEPS